MDKYYTPEQQAELERRQKELGDDGMAGAEADWTELIAQVRAELEAGSDPSSPQVQQLAVRWTTLIEAFTGGDPGIRTSLQQMYDAEGPEAASRGTVDREVMEYIGRAMGRPS
jgi:hypothetical protein